MAVRTGKCRNLGNCPAADSGAVQTIEDGMEFVCQEPDCGKPLIEINSGPNPRLKKLAIAGLGLVLLIALSAGAWRWMKPGDPVTAGGRPVEKLREIPSPSPETAPVPSNPPVAVAPPEPVTPPAPTPAPPTIPDKDLVTREELVRMDAKSNLQQGMMYARVGDYKNAIKEFSVAIDKDPKYAVAFSNRGAAYMQQREYIRALDDLRQASELDDSDPIIHYNLAVLYAVQKQFDLALDSLEQALERGFNDKEVLRKDPDLKNLRGRQDFKELLERYRLSLAGKS